MNNCVTFTWHGNVVDVMSSCSRVRPTLTITCQPSIDQARIFSKQLVWAKTQFLHHTWTVKVKLIIRIISPPVLHCSDQGSFLIIMINSHSFMTRETGLTFPIGLKHHIGVNTKPPEQRHAFWGLQVDGHRPFPPSLCVKRHWGLSSVHTNHLGSKVCKNHATERSRSQACQLDNSHSRQCHDLMTAGFN